MFAMALPLLSDPDNRPAILGHVESLEEAAELTVQTASDEHQRFQRTLDRIRELASCFRHDLEFANELYLASRLLRFSPKPADAEGWSARLEQLSVVHDRLSQTYCPTRLAKAYDQLGEQVTYARLMTGAAWAVQ
jgi:hypothetical protein